MKKFDLVETLKLQGFRVKDYHGGGGAVILSRKWYQEVEVVWYGKKLSTYSIDVSIYEAAGVCVADYVKDGRVCKSRWYNSIGKRAYNAMVETARYAGYEF